MEEIANWYHITAMQLLHMKFINELFPWKEDEKGLWYFIFIFLSHERIIQCWGQDSLQATQVLPHKFWQAMLVWTLICTQGQCHAGTDLRLLVPVKGNFNATACKYILYILTAAYTWTKWSGVHICSAVEYAVLSNIPTLGQFSKKWFRLCTLCWWFCGIHAQICINMLLIQNHKTKGLLKKISCHIWKYEYCRFEA